MTALEIKNRLRNMSWHGLFIDEFTFGNQRIDAVIVDTIHRWVRGFEIKMSRADFLRDSKWSAYTRFLSSLSIVCPEGLIKPEEIEKPFGLLWVTETRFQWKKRPCNFQERRNLAWLWTYIRILEVEVPRMKMEINRLYWQLGKEGDRR